MEQTLPIAALHGWVCVVLITGVETLNPKGPRLHICRKANLSVFHWEERGGDW